MPGVLPDGEPAPRDGFIPASAAIGSENRGLSLYVHVPFCAVRCGYCDFNTYTASELDGVSQDSYLDLVHREIELAGRVLRHANVAERAAQSVFFGGGTPTLLPAAQLVTTLEVLRREFGFQEGAEITVEANPDTVTAELCAELAVGGVTRLSIGMQSSTPHVLSTLQRTHQPQNVVRAVAAARQAGLDVSLDLIYGTPGETESDWRETLDSAIALKPDHISAYALIVESGTALARDIARGKIQPIDDDVHAQFYEIADQVLSEAGFRWYEVSNWAIDETQQSTHNMAYWQSDDWWGFGPGAHSHIGGVRWWNVKHPKAYAQKLQDGSPAQAREVLDDRARELERILLESRMSRGVALSERMDRAVIARLIADGLLDGAAAIAGRGILTLRGRLLADVVARDLTGP